MKSREEVEELIEQFLHDVGAHDDDKPTSVFVSVDIEDGNATGFVSHNRVDALVDTVRSLLIVTEHAMDGQENSLREAAVLIMSALSAWGKHIEAEREKAGVES